MLHTYMHTNIHAYIHTRAYAAHAYLIVYISNKHAFMALVEQTIQPGNLMKQIQAVTVTKREIGLSSCK